MAKQLKYSVEARQLLINGINQLANAVSTTLGPRGRNVAIDKKWGSPSVLHDGVSVAKEIELKDPFENMGAQLVKEAASKTNDDAGDGTTTSTILAQAIVLEGINKINAGANPMVIKRGLEKATKFIIKAIEDRATKVTKKSQVEQVATISAGDIEIGKTIAKALGEEGRVVSVEDGKGLTIDIEHKEGMEFDHGYVSAYFVTNPEKMEAEIEDAYLLLTDKKIASLQELLPFLEKFVKVSKNLVIIADEIEGEALATLVVNKIRGTFNILAVKAPEFGDRRKDVLEDIAVLTGGVVITEDAGRTFESIEVEDLGRADKVWADKESTRIIGGEGKKADISARVASIKRQIRETDIDFDKEKLEERLAKLSGGVAQINVGAATEIELNEKKERVKDAVGATKAAMESGIVPGGGVALLEASLLLGEPKNLEGINPEGDEAMGVEILKNALKFPARKLADNAGQNGGTVVDEILKKERGFGYDVVKGEYVNMVKAGIIDAAKVTISAVLNAVSVASMILTTEVLVSDLPEEKKETPAPTGGMDY